ncbi:NUDIX domain-containing protein [Bacillus sp. AFS055030]|uniref:NUDIX hydrolase n=1 Tax=Bacillus sp. AFS055030 TaxID=2033507 RepID=UPI000BFBBC08|nr:NUDIX domain-containing protein [Bacillus sp. AFS055030]PGL69819.1 UDP-sugar hydrolase [Bacillus sp. AFS055030]
MNDYINTMRKMVGNETILTVGCGAIIEDHFGRILLQRRRDYALWGIPGGLLEIGETIEGTVKREIFEETNLTIRNVKLFGIYSGENGFAQYANGDQVFSVQIIFHVTDYVGSLQSNNESIELCFLSKDEIPKNLNSHQAPFIYDWLNEVQKPIIK